MREGYPTQAEALPGSTRVPDGVSELFDSHADTLRRYLAARAGPDIADDLVSETFLIALRQWGTYNPALAPGPSWLFGIAANLLKRHRRSQTRHLTAIARLAISPSVEPEAEQSDRRMDAAASVHRLVPDLLRLKPADLDILLLNAWAGLEPAEIAVALGMPAPTVRTRLRRARLQLRQAQPDMTATATGRAHPTDPHPIGEGE